MASWSSVRDGTAAGSHAWWSISRRSSGPSRRARGRGEADEHLVRRHLLRAERAAFRTKLSTIRIRVGDREQQRRDQREAPDQQEEDLDRVGARDAHWRTGCNASPRDPPARAASRAPARASARAASAPNRPPRAAACARRRGRDGQLRPPAGRRPRASGRRRRCRLRPARSPTRKSAATSSRADRRSCPRARSQGRFPDRRDHPGFALEVDLPERQLQPAEVAPRLVELRRHRLQQPPRQGPVDLAQTTLLGWLGHPRRAGTRAPAGSVAARCPAASGARSAAPQRHRNRVRRQPALVTISRIDRFLGKCPGAFARGAGERRRPPRRALARREVKGDRELGIVAFAEVQQERLRHHASARSFLDLSASAAFGGLAITWDAASAEHDQHDRDEQLLLEHRRHRRRSASGGASVSGKQSACGGRSDGS